MLSGGREEFLLPGLAAAGCREGGAVLAGAGCRVGSAVLAAGVEPNAGLVGLVVFPAGVRAPLAVCAGGALRGVKECQVPGLGAAVAPLLRAGAVFAGGVLCGTVLLRPFGELPANGATFPAGGRAFVPAGEPVLLCSGAAVRDCATICWTRAACSLNGRCAGAGCVLAKKCCAFPTRVGIELRLGCRSVVRKLALVGTTGILLVTSPAWRNSLALTGCTCCGTRPWPNCPAFWVVMARRIRGLLSAPFKFDPRAAPRVLSGATRLTLVTFRMLVMFRMLVIFTRSRSNPRPNHGKNGSKGPIGSHPKLPNPKPPPKPKPKPTPPNPKNETYAGAQIGR
jgi:hypothetical protein